MDNDVHLIDVSENLNMPSIPRSRAAGGDVGDNVGSVFTPAKRFVVEKVPPNLATLRKEVGNTKAKNRDLRRLAGEEREKVGLLDVQRDAIDHHKEQIRSLSLE